MFEKVMQQTIETIKYKFPKRTENHKESSPTHDGAKRDYDHFDTEDPWAPRTTYKFKDNSSEDNAPKDRMKFGKKNSGRGGALGLQYASGAFGPRAEILGPRAPWASSSRRPLGFRVPRVSFSLL